MVAEREQTERAGGQRTGDDDDLAGDAGPGGGGGDFRDGRERRAVELFADGVDSPLGVVGHVVGFAGALVDAVQAGVCVSYVSGTGTRGLVKMSH